MPVDAVDGVDHAFLDSVIDQVRQWASRIDHRSAHEGADPPSVVKQFEGLLGEVGGGSEATRRLLSNAAEGVRAVQSDAALCEQQCREALQLLSTVRNSWQTGEPAFTS